MTGPTLGDWRGLVRIRAVEEGVWELHRAGEVAASMHLCIGQEAVSVGAVGALGPDDHLTVTYRGHGHALARGVPPEALVAEVLGRTTGSSGGRGGSMMIMDPARGLLLSSAIVGGAVPAAVGAALAGQRRGTGAVAMTFLGDGATGQGVVHECLNLAALWALPLVFVCENNLYAEMTPVHGMSAVADDLGAAMGAGSGMPAVVVDGNRVTAVRAAVAEAVARARRGEGPTFVEARTYRTCGHYTGDPDHYRPAEEVDAWRALDPLVIHEAAMVADGVDPTAIAAAREEVEREVASAIAAARGAERAGVRS